jgi:sulfite exporter TauE/SafE
VIEEPTLALVFVTGILGALHCLGMCSGIAGGFFLRYPNGSRVRPILLFHGSRILVYVAVGIAGAAAGRVLVQTGLFGKGQGALMMVAGALIVLLGMDLLGLIPRRPGNPEPIAKPAGIEVRLSGQQTAPGPWMPALAGALNGLVPCSLVFSVAVKAAATADPLRGGLLMAAFGIGTLPTMGLVSLTGALVGYRAKGAVSSLTGALVTALGLWTLYEGYFFFDIMLGLANW